MRTAEDYITTWKDINSTDGVTHRMILVEHAIVAINEAIKEAIEEAAKKTIGGSMKSENEIKQSILSLISELK